MINDIIFEFKKVSKTTSDYRKFGITIGIILSIVAGILWYYQIESYRNIFYIGLVFFLLGILFPILLKPLYYFWMFFATILGWVMTRVVLFLFFYLMITPVSFLGKLFGQKFLGQDINHNTESYWKKRDSEKERNQNYEHQY